MRVAENKKVKLKIFKSSFLSENSAQLFTENESCFFSMFPNVTTSITCINSSSSFDRVSVVSVTKSSITVAAKELYS